MTGALHFSLNNSENGQIYQAGSEVLEARNDISKHFFSKKAIKSRCIPVLKCGSKGCSCGEYCFAGGRK